MTSLCSSEGWPSASHCHPRATEVRLAGADSACLAPTAGHPASAAGATGRDMASACGEAGKETDHTR
jgi:hypothetical protein